MAPLKAWRGPGWLPRMPERLEALDLLLVMVAQSRMVRRDGGHLQGLRYRDTTLAASDGETVSLLSVPRAIAAMRILHRHRFLCRAMNPEQAGRTVTLKDMQTARARHRRSLRTAIKERMAKVADLLPDQAHSSSPPQKAAAPKRSAAPTLSPSLEDQP